VIRARQDVAELLSALPAGPEVTRVNGALPSLEYHSAGSGKTLHGHASPGAPREACRPSSASASA